MSVISKYAYAEAHQEWLEYVKTALNDEREQIVDRFKHKPRTYQFAQRTLDELRALDQRVVEVQTELQEHRARMRLVKEFDIRCGQRAGWP
jgi:hypothetical protein